MTFRLHSPRRAAIAAPALLLSACASLPTPARQDGGNPDPALVEAGRRHFVRCVACHTVSPDARPGAPAAMGPNLHGIVGRQAGSAPGFAYATPLKHGAFTWTRQRLDQWLRQPQRDIPGLCLPFTGLSRAADRKALIAFLEAPSP